MDPINYVVELTIKSGQLDAFKKVADGFIQRSRDDEPGTKTYQLYMAADDSKCYIHEGFDDSAGLVAHAAGPSVQGHIGELLEVSDITRFEAFGNPTKEAQEVLDGFGAVVHTHHAGFSR